MLRHSSLLGLFIGLCAGLLCARWEARPAVLLTRRADGARDAAEWARLSASQHQAEWYAQKLWQRLLLALPESLHQALRGVEAHESLPVCLGEAVKQRQLDHLGLQVGELRATWRDAAGTWRRADGRPCLSPQGATMVDPLPERGLRVRSAPREKSNHTARRAEYEEPFGVQIIALYQALDAALELLRTDSSPTSWELVARAHLALAVGVPGHLFAGEICAILSIAAQTWPSLLGSIRKTISHWLHLADEDLREDLSEIASLLSTEPGARPPILRDETASKTAAPPEESPQDTLPFVCNSLRDTSKAHAALASEVLIRIASSPAVTAQFQIIEPVGVAHVPLTSAADSQAKGQILFHIDDEARESALLPGTFESEIGRMAGTNQGNAWLGTAFGNMCGSLPWAIPGSLRYLFKNFIHVCNAALVTIARPMSEVGIISTELYDDTKAGATIRSFEWSLRLGPLFGTRIALMRVEDESLRKRLALFALSMHKRAAGNRSVLDNGAFFEAQMRNQDILDRNADVQQLKGIARQACASHILSNPRLAHAMARARSAHDSAPDLVAVLNEARLSLWATVLQPNASHARHNHEGNLCSGVFYAEVPDGAQPIVFDDPRGTPWRHLDGIVEESLTSRKVARTPRAPKDDTRDPREIRSARRRSDRLHSIGHWLPGERPLAPFTTQRSYSPSEGDLIVFPPWLSHSVPRAITNGGFASDPGDRASEHVIHYRGKQSRHDNEEAGLRPRGDESAIARGHRKPQRSSSSQARISYAFNLESPSAMVAWAFTV